MQKKRKKSKGETVEEIKKVLMALYAVVTR